MNRKQLKTSSTYDIEKWSVNKMRAYVTLARDRTPQCLSDVALEILKKYWTSERAETVRDQSRTSVRSLESLVRLTHAHARLMFRDQALACDAIEAVFLMEQSMSTTHSPRLENIFPPDGEEFHKEIRRLILSKLGMSSETISNEVDLYVNTQAIFGVDDNNDDDEDSSSDDEDVSL